MGHLASAIAVFVFGWIAWRVKRVRAVRYDRLHEIEARFKHLDGKLDCMTYEEATEILKISHYWEYPFSLALALSLALFKTYAIPSISKVLCMSDELSSPEVAGRRAEDTAVFLCEYMTEGLDSVRGSTTLARMNYLHSRWGNNIKQEDLLFTLSLFIFEPAQFVNAYEYRGLTETELQARFVFFAEIGARMGIANIPDNHSELWVWKEDYAKNNMVYHEDNRKTGEITLYILVKPLPNALKPLGKALGKTFLEDHVREAFGWPKPPRILYLLVPRMLQLRALFLRNFMFPRSEKPGFLTTQEVTETDASGHTVTKVQRFGFLYEPWYVPAGESSIGVLGYGKPGDASKWASNGWTSDSIGPEKLKYQGTAQVLEKAAEMREQARMCPFLQSHVEK